MMNHSWSSEEKPINTLPKTRHKKKEEKNENWVYKNCDLKKKNGINDLTCLKNYRGVWLLVGRVVKTVQKCELCA